MRRGRLEVQGGGRMTDKATVIIDDIEDSAIIDVEIRPTGEQYPAVAFNLDEEADVVRVSTADEDGDIQSILIPAQSFWLATVALARDNLTTELEALTSGSNDN